MSNLNLSKLDEVLENIESQVKELRNYIKGDVIEKPSEVITAEPELALEDVRKYLAELSRDGHTAQVKQLLSKYGANKLSEVKPSDYKSLLKDAEAVRNGSN